MPHESYSKRMNKMADDRGLKKGSEERRKFMINPPSLPTLGETLKATGVSLGLLSHKKSGEDKAKRGRTLKGKRKALMEALGKRATKRKK